LKISNYLRFFLFFGFKIKKISQKQVIIILDKDKERKND
jgi:hypothetical protein